MFFRLQSYATCSFYNTFVNMLYNTWLHVVSCLHTMVLYMVERKYANGRKHAMQAHNVSTQHKHATQAQNASNQHKHTTQAQNASTNGGDASRVGKRCGYLLEFIYSSFLYPDARRVAPIRGSVACLSCVLEYVRLFVFCPAIYIKVDRLASKRACQPVN